MTDIKRWLSRVKETSWHFKLVQRSGVSIPQKACAYYWVCVPRALGTTAVIYFICGVMLSVGWFVGFIPNFYPEYPNERNFFPYKMKKNGEQKFFAPWEVSAVALSIWSVIRVALWTSTHMQTVITASLWSIAIAAVLVSLVLAVLSIRRYHITHMRLGNSGFLGAVVRRVQRFWDRICPKLTIEK